MNTYEIYKGSVLINTIVSDLSFLEENYPEDSGFVFRQRVTQAEQEAKRQLAYTTEADPLFFQWQAGESTEAEWLAKREEIRTRFPCPA